MNPSFQDMIIGIIKKVSILIAMPVMTIGGFIIKCMLPTQLPQQDDMEKYDDNIHTRMATLERCHQKIKER